MLYRVRKFIIASANLSLLWLLFKMVTGQLDWGLALGSLLLSAFWLGLTALFMRSLLTTYYDWISRWRVKLPLVLGVALSAVALIANDSLVLRGIAVAELVAWAVIYFAWRRNAAGFLKTGFGPLPAGTWLNPPVEVIRPGDLILTSGRMAERMDQAVGHGEVAIAGENGRLMLLSSYMPKGTVINKADQVLRIMVKKGEHYIVLRLRNALTAEQNQRGCEIARGMLGENVAWRKEAHARREALIKRLWLPQSWRKWLDEKTAIFTTGYHWVGLFIGVKARNRWTCIGACAEWYMRNRVKMRHYGTGLLGMGTGILDPIQPQRFLTDPALELLVDKHREEYERSL
jgi:hypothetical protein